MTTFIILINIIRILSNSEIYNRENGTDISPFKRWPIFFEPLDLKSFVHYLFSTVTFWVSKYNPKSKESIIETKELVFISNGISILTIAYIIILIVNFSFGLEIPFLTD